jgi:hypothetical protein
VPLQVKWRVDLCVASKGRPDPNPSHPPVISGLTLIPPGVERELNEPSALVEIACKPAPLSKEDPTTLRFEMNREKLAEVNAKFDEVQACLTRVMAPAP